MNMRKFLTGTIWGVVLSLIGLILIAIIYSAIDRTPTAHEAVIVSWAVTIICYFCGNAITVTD